MPTILIVDDDEVDREMASRCLRIVEDLQIVQVASGKEALAAMGQRVPDLVLTDLRMPGIDGLQLVERLREGHSAVPVVLMTGKGSEQIAVQALKAGAASYVPKDDLKENLAETVEQVLDVVETRRSEKRVLQCLGYNETRFELDNDPKLVAPLAGFLQGNLERLSFSSDAVRTQVAIALTEALSNAVIHGNLEVGSELRQESAERYHALIQERRQTAPYKERRVRCTARESIDRAEYVILDEGPGFDAESLPDPKAIDNVSRVHGRGIMLIRTFMDEVEFNEKGNQVTMTKRNEVAVTAS